MKQQAVAFETTCTNGQHTCKSWAVQLISEGKLRWELDWSCEQCGIEADGGDWGPAPEHIRNRLIAEYGTACIKTVSPDGHGGKLLKAFRAAFGDSIQEAKKSASELTTTGWRGTHVEVSHVAQLLKSSGVEIKDCDTEGI